MLLCAQAMWDLVVDSVLLQLHRVSEEVELVSLFFPVTKGCLGWKVGLLL